MRRTSLRAAGVLFIALLPCAANAGETPAFPTKPVRIIVTSAAGGAYDDVARAISPRLTEVWGQQVIVENRAGAGGIIGATTVARANPDGYTYFLGQIGVIVINPNLYKKLPYDPRKDFVPVHLVLSSPMLLIVHPSVAAKSVKELVALAKSKPAPFNYASAGVGNLQHLGMEFLLSEARLKMTHVPYKGVAPALVDLIAGQVDLMFANIVGALPHVKSGRVRAIAIASAKRTPLLPDVPGVAETYPAFDVQGWLGLFAPTGTPAPIVAKVNRDMMRVLQLPAMQERLVNQGAEIIAGPPEHLAERMRVDWPRYAELIKRIGLTAE